MIPVPARRHLPPLWRRLRWWALRACGRPRGAWALATPLLLQELALVGAGAAMTWMASAISAEAVAAIGWVEVLAQLLHMLIGAVVIGTTVSVAQGVGKWHRLIPLPALKRRMAPIASDALALISTLGAALSVLLWCIRDPLIRFALPGAASSVHQDAGIYLAGVIVADLPLGLVLVGCAVLRGMGHTRVVMRIQLWMTSSQLLMAYGLMHIFHTGVAGAAVALVLSRLVALVWTLRELSPLWQTSFTSAHAEERSGMRALSRRWWRRGWRSLASKHARTIVRIGWPAAAETAFFHVGKVLTQSLVAAEGATAMAANFVAFALCAFINIPANALGQAGTTLVGQSTGAGTHRVARRQMFQLHRSATTVLIVLAVPVAVFASQLVAFFTSEAAVQTQAVQLIQLNCLFIPFWAASFVLPATLRGAADTRHTLLVATVSMWIGRVCLGWWLGVYLEWGVVGVWMGMFADWMVRGALFWHRCQSMGWKYSPHSTTAHPPIPPE